MDYRRLCRVLIGEVRRLRQRNEVLEDALDWAYRAAEKRERRHRYEERSREHERELEETYRAIEHDQVMRDLEHARSWRDTWAEERALTRLRELL